MLVDRGTRQSHTLGVQHRRFDLGVVSECSREEIPFRRPDTPALLRTRARESPRLSWLPHPLSTLRRTQLGDHENEFKCE